MSNVSAPASLTAGRGHPVSISGQPTFARFFGKHCPPSRWAHLSWQLWRLKHGTTTRIFCSLWAAQILADRKIAKFYALVAQGTHAPMSDQDKRTKIGAVGTTEMPGLSHIFDHDWADPEKLVTIGVLWSRPDEISI